MRQPITCVNGNELAADRATASNRNINTRSAGRGAILLFCRPTSSGVGGSIMPSPGGPPRSPMAKATYPTPAVIGEVLFWRRSSSPALHFGAYIHRANPRDSLDAVQFPCAPPPRIGFSRDASPNSDYRHHSPPASGEAACSIVLLAGMPARRDQAGNTILAFGWREKP
jgi:hypothetical protein